MLINSDGTAAYASGKLVSDNIPIIFRFDPTDTVSTSPVWQKKWSIHSSFIDIVYGANDSVIFEIVGTSGYTYTTLIEDVSSPPGNWRWTRYSATPNIFF